MRNFDQKGKQYNKYHNWTENAFYISSWIDEFKPWNVSLIFLAVRGQGNYFTEPVI